MENQNKPRLSQVTKKNTTDRASKLAGAFLPAPPAPAPVATPPADTPAPESLHEVIDRGEADFVEGRGTTLTVDEMKAAVDPKPVTKPAAPDRPKERTRRASGSTLDLIETINQPVPKDLSCKRMIMLSDDHHDLLRELSFKFKMPMTAILYNLLEPAHQANEKLKGGSNHV